MAFGSFESGNDQPMSEINTTPLVDVMLVLLIIFIVTTPLLTQSYLVELPETSGAPDTELPEDINLQIDANGQLLWNDEAIVVADLERHFAALAKEDQQPNIFIVADKSTPYEYIAEIMGSAKSSRIEKLGFKILVE